MPTSGRGGERLERLDKYVSAQTGVSRSEAGRLIRGGQVAVDGVVRRDPAYKLEATARQVEVSGRPVAYQRQVYYMLNKPPGILCVSRDPRARTVVDLLPPTWRRRGLFPAGRLDKDTVGLVLLTDDGAYAHRLLSPRSRIVKRYQAVLDAPVGEEHVALFAQGTSLADGTVCLPAKLHILSNGTNPLVEVHICEGKYHQIKRMFAAMDRKVLWLKRYSIGGLELDPLLAEGAARPLTAAEQAAALADVW